MAQPMTKKQLEEYFREQDELDAAEEMAEEVEHFIEEELEDDLL